MGMWTQCIMLYQVYVTKKVVPHANLFIHYNILLFLELWIQVLSYCIQVLNYLFFGVKMIILLIYLSEKTTFPCTSTKNLKKKKLINPTSSTYTLERKKESTELFNVIFSDSVHIQCIIWISLRSKQYIILIELTQNIALLMLCNKHPCHVKLSNNY